MSSFAAPKLDTNGRAVEESEKIWKKKTVLTCKTTLA
jgi:hypothetical protein